MSNGSWTARTAADDDRPCHHNFDSGVRFHEFAKKIIQRLHRSQGMPTRLSHYWRHFQGTHCNATDHEITETVNAKD